MRLVLSATEFRVTWEELSLGEPPPVLDAGPAHGVLTEQEHAQLTANAIEALRQRGLAAAGGPVPELAEVLGVLAGPRWAIEARLVSGHPDATDAAGGLVRAYGAAGDGDEAVLAIMADGALTLTQTTAPRLPTEMAMLAGEVQPGPSRSINVRADVLYAATEASDGDPHRLAEELVARGVPVGHAGTTARISGEFRRSGQFAVRVTGPDGALHPGRRSVGFNDTAQGRWAQLRTGGNGEPRWLTFTPASATQLAAMISNLLADSAAHPTR